MKSVDPTALRLASSAKRKTQKLAIWRISVYDLKKKHFMIDKSVINLIC